MKKLRGILLLLFTLVCGLMIFAACGEEGGSDDLKTITGITFADKTVTYDGTEHEITVSGTLPEGVTVAYTGNKGTDVGTYAAKATLSGEGYKTLELTATLTVEGRTITGITFTDKTVEYNGEEHEITITGTLPDGVSVEYSCAEDSGITNKTKEAGVYNITATLSGTGYKTLTLTATLTINGTDITGVTFTDKAVDYNGTEHTITVTGTLPGGVSVVYSCAEDAAVTNSATNAGIYNITAKLTGEGYNPLTLKAKLEIRKIDFPTITFNGKTETYNGNPYSVAIDESNLPANTTVTYSCAEDSSLTHTATNAGTYTITLTVTNPNYNTFTKTVELKIEKADFPTITFRNKSVMCNGEPHTIEISVDGTLPAGTTVEYSCAEDETITNTATEVGTYTIKVRVTNPNYVTFDAEATLNIYPNPDLAGIAQAIINAFGSVPDVWQFLPDSFRLTEARAYSGNMLDFTNNVNVSAIPKTGIGKQLDVVYGTVINMQELLGKVNTFYASAGTIAELYQTFINNHPDNYRVFEGQTAGGAIQFRIELNDKQYTLLAKMTTVSLELYADAEDGSYAGRVQLSDTNALKYEVEDDHLKIGLKILDKAVTQLEFVRDDDVVTGYLYESLGATIAGAKREISTSALLTWEGDYVSVCGTNGDFFLGSKGQVVELYDAVTGRYLGAKVKETISKIVYNTYWFNLFDFTGFTSVRVDGSDIYVNGSSTKFENKKVGGISAKTASRRYDIETKKIYFYTYDAQTEKYTKTYMEIPMLFVQAEVYDTLAGDMKEKNSSLNITNNVSSATVTTLDYYYEDGLAAYELIADLVTGDDIIAYVGNKNAYFN